jgi:hypothetical protein
MIGFLTICARLWTPKKMSATLTSRVQSTAICQAAQFADITCNVVPPMNKLAYKPHEY